MKVGALPESAFRMRLSCIMYETRKIFQQKQKPAFPGQMIEDLLPQ